MTNREFLERDPKLAELVRRLVAAHQPARLYLFGSRGRGQAAFVSRMTRASSHYACVQLASACLRGRSATPAIPQNRLERKWTER